MMKRVTTSAVNSMVAIAKDMISGPVTSGARAASEQMGPSSGSTYLYSSSRNQPPAWLRSKFCTNAEKEGGSVINTEVKDIVVSKQVDMAALKPLENVYGGGPEGAVSPIPDSEIATKDGTFKYCVTKHKETHELDVLMAEDNSAAHVGLLEIAGKKNSDVVMAGHVTLHGKEGGVSEVYSITNTSGHLQPEGTYEQQQVAEHAFNSKGLDAQGRYTQKKWDEGLGKYVGKQTEGAH